MKRVLLKPTKGSASLVVRTYDGEACINGNDNKVNINGGGCDSTTIDLGGILDIIGKFIGKGK